MHNRISILGMTVLSTKQGTIYWIITKYFIHTSILGICYDIIINLTLLLYNNLTL